MMGTSAFITSGKEDRMKRYLILLAVALTAVPSFGLHGQPKASSQFHGTGSRPRVKTEQRSAVHPRGGTAARGKTAGTSAGAARGKFVKRAQTSATVATVG